MKLRELISRVEFDRIIPTLRTYDNMDGQIIHYKEAYDELRTITANDTEHVISINLSEGYVSVYGCGELWETCLGSEIIIGEELTLTEEEILAHIMWEITFYGYSSREFSYMNDEPDNEYSRKAQELYERRWCNYSRGVTWRTFDGMRVIDYEESVKVHKRMEHRNRPKRMRDARLERMIKRYKRMGKVEECIRKILSFCPDISHDSLNFLFDTSLIFETTYRAYPKGSSKGVDTLWELFSKYCETDFSQYDGLIFILYANDATMFTQAEIEQFKSYFEAQKKFDKLIFRVESLPSLDDGQSHCFIVGYHE